MPGSPLRGFSASDPIRLLAHNLDFWLPPVTEVVHEILRDLPVVDNGVTEQPPRLEDGTVLEGTVAANPRKGSDLWQGEVEAAEAVRWTVEEADADGRLRGILDAVRSNRVEDDFSEHWSYAREDFERKLYRKRSKVRVRFVELTDTIPVQGPETEVEDDLVFADVLALLDERERQVVVVLRSGVTKVGDVARTLGYKTTAQSPSVWSRSARRPLGTSVSSDTHAAANLAGSGAADADEIEKIEVTERLFAEVDRQLVELREQSTGLATRSGLLISVTAVAAAVLLANLGRVKTGDVIAFVALGVAALAGVVTVIPGLELGPRAMYLARGPSSTRRNRGGEQPCRHMVFASGSSLRWFDAIA